MQTIKYSCLLTYATHRGLTQPRRSQWIACAPQAHARTSNDNAASKRIITGKKRRPARDVQKALVGAP
eukprot:6552255-Pyramimonas_sp.AAC.1